MIFIDNVAVYTENK